MLTTTALILADIKLGDAVNIAAAVLGIIVLIAGAVVFSRASLVKAQLEALRGDRDDLQARVDRLEQEGKEKDNKITQLETKAQALETVVTGREQLEIIISSLHQLINSATRTETMLNELGTIAKYGRPPRPSPNTKGGGN